MGKLIKWLIGIVGVLVLLIVIAAVVLPMIIDPNDYKDDIAAAVKERTGRELTISEPLELSVFPWLGIKAGGVSLSNAKGFSDAPFASLGKLQLRARLLPLLSGKVQVDTIVLDGLVLNMERNARGAANWEGLAGEPAKAKETDKPSTDTGGGHIDLDVQGIDVRNAKVVWDDRQSKARYVLTDLTLTSGAISSGSTAPIEMRFQLDTGEGGMHVTLALDGTLTFGKELGQFTIPDLSLIVRAEGGALPDLLLVDANGEVSADLAAERISLNKLKAGFDDSTLTGSVGVDSFAGPAMQLKLDLDKIDLDKYLPPAGEGQAAAAEAGGGTKAKSADDPLAGLRGLVLDGQINIGSLKVRGLTIQDVKVTLNAKDGVMRVDPLQALLYQGKLSARIELDARNKTPRIAVRNALTGIQAGPLLKDLNGKETIDGKGDVNFDLTTRGLDDATIRRTLNGTARIAFKDGAIKGVNIPLLIRQAQARLSGTPLPDGPAQTDFTELTGSARITNGVVDNQDLMASSPLLRIQGKGQANLPAEQLDYRLTAELVRSLEGQGSKVQDLTGLPIPVKITGSFADPKYAVDLQSVLQSKVKEQAKQKIEEAIQDKAGDKVKGLLKGFGF